LNDAEKYIFFFAISYILISIFTNESPDDENFNSNDKISSNLNFMEINHKKYVIMWYN
jgi:hypothetical protein